MATKTRMSDQDYRQRFEDQMSDTTRRATWIDSTEQHAEHDGQTLATRDHDVIMRWVEERDAEPATVQGSRYGDRPGVLRFDFPGYSEGRLERIDWDKWFETFDERDLVMLYQEKLSNGNRSNFFRFDSPHREQG